MLVSTTRRVSKGTGEVYTEVKNALYDLGPGDGCIQKDQIWKTNEHLNEPPRPNEIEDEESCYDTPGQQHLNGPQFDSDREYANIQQ